MQEDLNLADAVLKQLAEHRMHTPFFKASTHCSVQRLILDFIGLFRESKILLGCLATEFSDDP